MRHTALLESRSVLRLTGDDALPFLQSLVTCDVENLEQDEAAFGALLTPQGKILFDFFLQRTGDGFLLDVGREKTAELAKRLTFYKLRAAVDIVETDLRVFAIWGGDSAEGFADPRYDKLGNRAFDVDLESNASEADWHTMRIGFGMPHSGLDFELGAAFPHEVLMDQFGGVDFSKGCYVGQEVVSRMEHRGTARNRIVNVSAGQAADLPEFGTEIVSNERSLGKMGSSTGAHGVALVRLDRMGAALSANQPVLAGETPLNFSRPDFAQYEWPNGAE